MLHLNDNFYLRNHFLNSKTVPTQSLIKKKMHPPLAAVYFKSMNPKLKVMAGLEPPMKGGGGDWYVPPKDLLEGKTILKPVDKACLSKLNYLGIDNIGRNMLAQRLKRMRTERDLIINENDEMWKRLIEIECMQYKEDIETEAAKKNTERIQSAFREFTNLYVSSISLMENVLSEAARNQIIKIQNEAQQKMHDKYGFLIKQQATELYDIYEEKMMQETAGLKANFLEKLELNRTITAQKIHDRNLEKHAAIEKLRAYLECKNLACQVYVALNERESCKKEMEKSHYEHQKKVRTLKADIETKDFKIMYHIEQEKKREEFHQMWREKCKRVIKKFQLFVSYCLRLLPQHAEFFINMEKLMLLQVNETIENPSAESIIVMEEHHYEGPAPKPHPFFLFCDKNDKYKTPIKEDLCPQHCKSESQMPVIIINKRCMYAACDNFQQFTNKIKVYIHGKKGDDADFVDDHIYEHDVPVKSTSSQQLLELKLESSLMQVLQQELANLKQVPIECGECKIPYCFCYSRGPMAVLPPPEEESEKAATPTSFDKIETRSQELLHEREPKVESYIKYVEPRKCACVKRAKKHLVDSLPIYMRDMSKYEEPELPHYEKCSLTTLKKMVRVATGYHTPLPPVEAEPLTRDVYTECSDYYFDILCECFAEDEIRELYKETRITGSKMYDPLQTRQFHVVTGSQSDMQVIIRPSSRLETNSIGKFGKLSDLKEIYVQSNRKPVD